MRRPWFALTSTLVFFLLHSTSTKTSTTTTHAQTYQPRSLYFVNSVFVEHKALYVHGGLVDINSSPSAQTFALDLSINWTTTQPAFIQRPDGFPGVGTVTALSSNKTIWWSIYNSTMYSCNLEAGNWGYYGSSLYIDPYAALPAVVDPAKNQFYVLNGWTNNTAKNSGTVRFDPAQRRLFPQNLVLPLRGSFTAVWSTLRGAALIFGGFSDGDPIVSHRTLYIYQPNHNGSVDTPSLTTAHDSGAVPPARFGHCMVEAYNGSKMILFGGYDESGNALGDIYILDVASLKWTAGTPGGPLVARRHTACAVTNDLFVAWGGASPDPQTRFSSAVMENVTIVYNLRTNAWQTTYSPDPYVLPPLVNTTTTTTAADPAATGTEDGELSPALVAIVSVAGGIVLGVILMAIGFGVYWYRRRRRTSTKSDDRNDGRGGGKTSIVGEDDGTSWHGQPYGYGGGREEILDVNDSGIGVGQGQGQGQGHPTFLRVESASPADTGRTIYMMRQVPNNRFSLDTTTSTATVAVPQSARMSGVGGRESMYSDEQPGELFLGGAQQAGGPAGVPLTSTQVELKEYLNYIQFIREQQQHQQQYYHQQQSN